MIRFGGKNNNNKDFFVAYEQDYEGDHLTGKKLEKKKKAMRLIIEVCSQQKSKSHRFHWYHCCDINDLRGC